MPWVYSSRPGRYFRSHVSWSCILIHPTSGQLWAKWFPFSGSASARAHVTFRDTHFLFWQVQTEPGHSCVKLTSVPWTFHPVALSLPSGITKSPSKCSSICILRWLLYPLASPLSLPNTGLSHLFLLLCSVMWHLPSGLWNAPASPAHQVPPPQFFILMYSFKSVHFTAILPF